MRLLRCKLCAAVLSWQSRDSSRTRRESYLWFENWSYFEFWISIEIFSLIAAVPMGVVVVESDTDLHSMRRHVMRLAQVSVLQKTFYSKFVEF